jgi:uncharacterized protein YdaU (DUF1376 family)
MAKRNSLAGEFFWVDRWNASTAFYLPVEARGLYREMLSQAWLRGAKLPKAPEAIKRIVGATDAEWERSWPLVSPYWAVRGDLIVNETQLEIYDESLRLHEKKVEGGRLGGMTRVANAQRKESLKESLKDASSKPSRVPQLSGSVSVSRSTTTTQPALPELPKECSKHYYRPACERGLCVYGRLHQEFVRKIGGDVPTANQKAIAFYTRTIKALGVKPVAEDAYTFWRREFEEQGKKSKPSSSIPGADETQREIAARREMAAAADKDRDTVLSKIGRR